MDYAGDVGCIHGVPVDEQCVACAYLAVMTAYGWRRRQEQR